MKKWCFVVALGRVRGQANIAREGSQQDHATSELRSYRLESHFNGSSGGESGSPKIGAETGYACGELDVVTLPITNVQASLNTTLCIRAMSRYELAVDVEREFFMEPAATSTPSPPWCFLFREIPPAPRCSRFVIEL